MSTTDKLVRVVAELCPQVVEDFSELVAYPSDTADEVRASLMALERVRRMVDSAMVAAVGELERSGAFRVEGARSPGAYVKHVCRVSVGEAARLRRAARALHVLPHTAGAYQAGEISAGQVDVVARVYENPRVQGLVADIEEALVADAKTSSYQAFREGVAEWERLADEDGALAATERQHANRTASMHRDFDGSWQLTGGFGSAQGAAISEILERFERVELEADWDKARAEHGEHATVEHLPRTAGQRRADALWNVFVTAASTPTAARRPEPLVNIVMSQREWELAVARATNTPPPEPAPGATRRCSTLEGNPIDLMDAFAAALEGQVRRVVVNGAGVVINMSRNSRLFAGSARDAALLAGAGCVWVGCDQIGSHNQIDHIDEWQHLGPSNQDNAGVLCRFHNRWKSSHRYRIQRDPDGTWHTYKPSGTEIH